MAAVGDARTRRVGARTDTATECDANAVTRADVAPHSTLADPAFRADVLAGLSGRPRAIPARWFYDRHGSELFEDITRLPEYYLTRT
jgi:hypothetical protein